MPYLETHFFSLEQTFIDIFHFRLLEPVTVLTDVLLSIFCMYFYNKLNFPCHAKKLGLYWRLFFLFMGISTFIGAIAHGCKLYFSNEVFYFVWMTMNVCSIPSAYYLLKATIELSEFKPELKKRLTLLAATAMTLLMLLTMWMNNFVLIKVNAGIVITLTLIRHYHTYKKGYSGSGYIVFGFAFSLLSIIVHTAQLSISNWFNFKDISHVIMNISLYIIFTGVLLKTRSIQPGRPANS